MSIEKLSNNSLKNSLAIGCSLTLAIAVVAFRLWEIDIKTPFNYTGDTLWFLVPIKGIIQNGWTYDIQQLSAPFGLSAAGFPSMTNFDWFIMKIIALFSNEPGTVLNAFWLTSIALTTCTAIIALHLLGVNSWLSICAALVYAFLPYSLLRNVAHISLVYYTVPLLAMLAIHIARDSEEPKNRPILFWGYAAAVVQGLNYIYFSFFAVIIFIFSGLLGFTRHKSWTPINRALKASCLLLIATSISLIPSFLSWNEHGTPPTLGYKKAFEAEIYGLKIRKMLVPHEANAFPLFSQWGLKDKTSGFPNENENTTARLGPMAALGFLLLLAVSLGILKPKSSDSRERETIFTIASLSLFCLLFTTIGGFGAIFNQLISDFRGYNRFSVFIAFLALAGLMLFIQKNINWCTKSHQKKLCAIIVLGITCFSLYDQLLDIQNLSNRRSQDGEIMKMERDLVKFLETNVPIETQIFQLPLTEFPTDSGREGMQTYDHARPTFWSSNLRWSWPSFSQRHQTWISQLQELEGEEFVNALILSGFRLVWIDRYGYPDKGSEVISSLLSAGAKEIAHEISQRYVILDLASATTLLKTRLGEHTFEQQRRIILNGPTYLEWSKDFYGLERTTDGRKLRWSRANSSITVSNSKKSPWSGTLTFSAASLIPGNLVISYNSNIQSVILGLEPVNISLPLSLDPFSKITITFASDGGIIPLPSGETRDLHFFIMDLKPKSNVY